MGSVRDDEVELYILTKSVARLSNKLAEHMNTNRSCSSYDTAKSPPLSSLNMLLPIYHNRFLRVFSPWTTIKHTNCPFIDSHLRNKSRSVFPSSEVTILRNYLHHAPHCNRTSGLNEEEMKLEVNPSKSSLIRSRYWKSSKRS